MNIKKFFKNEKVNNLIKYSSIKYVALIIGFVKGIVNARALGPELLGVVGNLLLVLSYLSYSNFGILYSMNREYVIYESKGDMTGAKKVIKTSFTALFILSILLLITGVSTKFIYKRELGSYILLTFIIGILEQYRAFYINYFRLVDNFRKINYIELINNVLSFVLIIISIRYFKIYSVLISMLIADCIVFIYGYKKSEKITLSVDIKVLKNLIIVGLPLLVYNLGFYILTTVDRVMTIKFLGYEDLGYYTFSNQIVGGTLVFITSVLFLYYPKAIKNLNINSNNDIREVLSRTEEYTKYVEVFGVILCITGAILIKPFVNIVVPQYSVSIDIYRILVFGTIVNQISYFSNVFIVSNKKQIYLIYLQVITVILAIILNFIFIKLGIGIIGVSLATLITNAIYSIMQHVIYLKLLNIKGSYIRNILKVYSKFIIYMIISIILSLININFVLYSVFNIVITVILYFKDIKKTIINIGKI
ncbi:lipopolysaccharide biosynthesis protein [Clostridium algidicarnis]|uniref:O-antigen/teichoic acid export membrane protein n=1 Tax=Clostridium algidicarnis DSM 15099 TaxID=1121295 RepID=A0A2S6FVG9_9CLOT|nr:oligosaccharide flippase family protein [Clostridium algidicarnis]PPK46360.1 O-antigen/teichoic acid export membrane protein [Clostridium algidicarnis DSM 15099]